MAGTEVIDRLAMARRGRRLEYFTIVWNILEGIVAVAAGAVAGSIFWLDSESTASSKSHPVPHFSGECPDRSAQDPGENEKGRAPNPSAQTE